MPKPKRCNAITKKGARCKNPVVTNGRCGIHPLKPKRFEQVERGVKFVGSVAGGVAGLIKVIEYVVAHWPTIESAFHFHTMNGFRFDSYHFIEELDSRRIYPGNVTYAFNRWFIRLPKEVQDDVNQHFGDVLGIAQSASEEIRQVSARTLGNRV